MTDSITGKPPAAKPPHGGTRCRTQGATGVSKHGTDMICDTAKDGHLRWQRQFPKKKGSRRRAPQVNAVTLPAAVLAPAAPAKDEFDPVALAAALHQQTSATVAREMLAGLNATQLKQVATAVGVAGLNKTKDQLKTDIVYMAVTGPRTLLRAMGDEEEHHRPYIPASPTTFEQATAPKTLEERIHDAYRDLAAGNEGWEWVGLSRLRAHPALAGVSREDVDQALHDLAVQDGVNVVPESNQKTLTADDRRDAVAIGNQNKHLISFGQGYRPVGWPYEVPKEQLSTDEQWADAATEMARRDSQATQQRDALQEQLAREHGTESRWQWPRADADRLLEAEKATMRVRAEAQAVRTAAAQYRRDAQVPIRLRDGTVTRRELDNHDGYLPLGSVPEPGPRGSRVWTRRGPGIYLGPDNTPDVGSTTTFWVELDDRSGGGGGMFRAGAVHTLAETGDGPSDDSAAWRGGEQEIRFPRG